MAVRRAGQLATAEQVGNLPMSTSQYASIGAVLLILGLVQMAAAGWFGYLVLQDRDEAVSKASSATQDCMAALRQGLGFGNVQLSAGRIVATQTTIDQAALSLGQATVASLICPGWEMQSFCMGADCPSPGTTIVLSQIEG